MMEGFETSLVSLDAIHEAAGVPEDHEILGYEWQEGALKIEHRDPERELVTVRFYPQVWEDDRALTGDPFVFQLPRRDVVNDHGEFPEDNSHESDQLRAHPDAPSEARKWQGPFYVEVEVPDDA